MEGFLDFLNISLYRIGDADFTLGRLLSLLLVLVVGYVLSRLLEKRFSRFLERANFSSHHIQTLQRILFYTLIVGVALTVLALMNIPITAFAFLTGAVAIGVGFGAQNIINNFISGWILMTEQPVRVDDFVEIDNHSGVVERIGNRSTRIRRVDGVHLLVPNSQMLERVVVNWTLIDHMIRTMVRVGVAYGSAPRKVEQLLEQVVGAHSDILADPAPRVIFEDFGDNALVFDIIFWCNVSGEREMRKIRSDIRFAISDLFSANAITIAFPQRDVHLGTAEPLRIQMIEPKAQAIVSSEED